MSSDWLFLLDSEWLIPPGSNTGYIEGCQHEQLNTEKERIRADQEEQRANHEKRRAEIAETELMKLKAEPEKLR